MLSDTKMNIPAARGEDVRAVQRALWSCFQLRRGGVYGSAGTETMGIEETIAVVQGQETVLPPGALVFAVWNLSSVVRAHDPGYQAIDRLSRHLFGRTVDESRAWDGQRSSGALPPDPSHRILESSSRTEQSGRAVTAAVDLCIHDDLHKLCWLADPRAWSTYGLFWTGIERDDRHTAATDTGWPGVMYADLTLPCFGTMKVALDVDVSVAPLQTRTDFASHAIETMKSSELRLNGFLRMEKERGRPGVTRVWNQRTVRLPSDQPEALGASIVSYWLQLETLCLGLAEPKN